MAAAYLDPNAVTPDMLAACGMNQQRFRREMAAIPMIPVTQDDRDELGRVRQRKLRVVRIGSIALILVSIPSAIIGGVTMSLTSNVPYSLGGGLIAAVPGIIIGLVGLYLAKESEKTPTGDTTTQCFQCLTKCHLILVYSFLTFLMSSWGLAGIWGLVDCVNRTPEHAKRRFDTNNCTPNSGALLALSLLTVIVVAVLCVLIMITCCAVTCNLRAFGIKSGYEMLLDMQQARMMEMQRLQQQQQQQQQQHPMGMYGGQPLYGGQPQMAPQQYQGYPNQPQGSPRFAPQPPAPHSAGYGANQYNCKDSDPPSYYDAMKQ